MDSDALGRLGWARLVVVELIGLNPDADNVGGVNVHPCAGGCVEQGGEPFRGLRVGEPEMCALVRITVWLM